MHQAIPQFCKSRRAGFTLIEMMLAVMVVAITATLVVVNVERDESDIARLEARRFAALVSHVQDESIIAGYPLGVSVELMDKRYRFYTFTEAWKIAEGDHVLRPRQVPERVDIEFRLLQTANEPGGEDSDDSDEEQEDADEVTAADKGPDPAHLIVAEPSGLITPFVATFRGGEAVITVSLDQFNTIQVSGAGS